MIGKSSWDGESAGTTPGKSCPNKKQAEGNDSGVDEPFGLLALDAIKDTHIAVDHDEKRPSKDHQRCQQRYHDLEYLELAL